MLKERKDNVKSHDWRGLRLTMRKYGFALHGTVLGQCFDIISGMNLGI